MSTASSTAPAPPLALDHAHNTYLVLSTSSASPPQLPPFLPAPLPALHYIGAIGPGIMATEHVVALPLSPSESERRGEEMKAVIEALRRLEGVEGVEVMQAKTRSKR